ncbi:MAG: hypothetical protein KDD89_03660 [Anaerolineales bacterium]|nr:hypothetical protein [Anaerolineales bacterium]
MQKRLPTILAITIGLIVAITLILVPSLAQSLLQWGSIIAAFVLIVGLLNLLAVHLRRVTQQRNLLSLVVVVSFLAVFLLGITDLFGVTNDWVGETYNLVLRPLEIAFTALLAFILLAAGLRMVRAQRTVWSILFIVSALFVLIASLPLPLIQTTLGNWLTLYNDIVVSAGMRGILIGVALATIVIALRILVGSDQPYNK